ncbi:MFS transporter, partial [Deinococcus sp.]|uniref:MFS transporter n=1 Tax=Deinococcus sp. TaxID=47478 RepID=UPI0025F82A52
GSLVGSLLMRRHSERPSGSQTIQPPTIQPPTIQVEQTLPVPPPRPARALPWVVGAFVLYGMSLVMGMNFLPLLVTKTLGGDTAQVGFLVSFCAFLEIPMMLALVTLRRLPSLSTLIKLALALFVVQFALTALAQGMAPLILSQVLRAAGIAVMAGLGMTYFQKLMPGRFTAATTLFANTTSVGGVLSGVVSGAWAQAFGYRSVFVLCAVLGLLAWGVMEFALRRRGDVAAPVLGAELE